MKKSFFRPDRVNFVFFLIAACLFYLLFIILPVVCFGQECADGKCGRVGDVQPSQVRFAPTGTIASQKNSAVARLEHDDYKGRGYFTGFFTAAPNGLRANILVTAAHCFDGPGETRIYLPDGRMFKGEVLELDHIWDVAVVMVEGANIPAMRLATVAPARGDPISAYGYGWVGKQYARINGVALGYSIFRGQNVRNTLKCSFEVRDGDSGGPMVNSRCEVVAVISCSDDQSGTHGTWAARIKVIVDRAIARKIKQTSFAVKKEDTGKLPPPPVALPVVTPSPKAAARLVEARVAPPVEAGAANIERSVASAGRPTEIQQSIMKAPSTGLGLPIGSLGKTASGALALALQVAAVVGGLGLTGGVGWGGWAIVRSLIRSKREIMEPADSPADSFSTLSREAKEARQLLQLSELEGRSPLFDALIGRLAFDELDNIIDSDRPEKDFAVQLKERLMRRFNDIAPVSVKEKDDKRYE